MRNFKSRVVVLAVAALVGAVIAPTAFTKKGADDPAGHVRHAKTHAKKHAAKRSHKARATAKGRKGDTATGARGREQEPGDDRGQVAEPGDDRGQVAEPGDDRGQDNQAEPGDDRGQHNQAGDDRGGRDNDDGSGHH